ncbi:MAG TPA: hypothetical protein VJJ02_03970 [Candidatus Paceibacterota bacterium]
MNNRTVGPSPVSIHEAGHVVMAWLMEIPICGVVIDERGGRVQLSTSYHLTDMYSIKDHEEAWKFAQGLIQMLLAGRCAERIFFRGISRLNSQRDLLRVFILAGKFGRTKDIRNINDETQTALLTHKRKIHRIAERLEQKKILSSANLAVMQKEFADGRWPLRTGILKTRIARPPVFRLNNT